jgi:hypothetical protein
MMVVVMFTLLGFMVMSVMLVRITMGILVVVTW